MLCHAWLLQRKTRSMVRKNKNIEIKMVKEWRTYCQYRGKDKPRALVLLFSTCFIYELIQQSSETHLYFLRAHEIKPTWKVVVISGVIVRVPPFSVVCGGRMNSLVDAVTLLSSKWNVKFILSSETRKTLSATSSFASLDLLRWNLSTIFC